MAPLASPACMTGVPMVELTVVPVGELIAVPMRELTVVPMGEPQNGVSKF